MSGFDVGKFVESFPVMVEAEGGSAKLRALAIELAVCGDLECDSAPSQWKRVALGDIVESFQNGLSKRRGDAGVPVPVLRLADIERGERLRESDLREIVLTAAELEQYRVGRGDVLVIRVNGSADLVGRFVPCGVDRVWAYSDHLIRLRLRADLVDARFLCAVSRSASARQYLAGKTVTTAGQRTINQGGLAGLSLLVPPLAEQKRIVAKVDELMRLIDQLEAKQAKKREVQTRFRAAALGALTAAEGEEAVARAWGRVAARLEIVLSSADDVAAMRAAFRGVACAGWLSARHRGSFDGNGHSLVGAIASDRRRDRATFLQAGVRPASLPPQERAQFPDELMPSVPVSWTVCGVEDLLAGAPNAMKAGPFGSALTKAMYVARGYKVYGQEQVIAGDHRVGSYYVDQEKFDDLKSCAVLPGDMLVSLMGTVGRVLILPSDAQPGIINPRLLKLTLSERVSARWVKLCLESPQARTFIDAQARGVAMDGLNIAILRALPLPLPPLAEQHWLVAKVDALMKLCDDLEAKLAAKEAAAARLVEAVVREMAG